MMNQLAYEHMVEALRRGKQVMIFVHSRKETGKTLQALRELCVRHGTLALLETSNITAAAAAGRDGDGDANADDANRDDGHHDAHHASSAQSVSASSHPVSASSASSSSPSSSSSLYSQLKRQVERSRNAEVQQWFGMGMGMHHAGMLRADRALTETLFSAGMVRVLCCTATLVWGVNLPAHTVIVKGTEVYEPDRGGFVDLSLLDVLQIFGRAGEMMMISMMTMVMPVICQC